MPEPETGKVSVELSDGVARIALDRPGQLNALNYDIRGQLAAGLRQALSNADTRVILILGSGTRAFAAGADVEELIDLTPEQSLDLSLFIERFHAEIEMAPLPVVACIRGWCLGGGLELALAADIRVASNTAKFGLPEITLGILPGGGGVARLSRIAGTAAARHLCLTGRIIDAERAHRLASCRKSIPMPSSTAVSTTWPLPCQLSASLP